MDPLTTALSGALLARAATQPQQQFHPGRHILPLRLQIATGFAAAAFPDIDLVLRLIDTLTYLNWHQGPTHSLLLLPIWAWLLAQFFSSINRNRYRWKCFVLPASLGIAIHIAGDLITSYGLMLFAPFSTERFALPLVFVIDPWFTLIIIVGLIATWCYPQQRIAAILALVVLCGYVFFLWTLHQQAVNLAKNYIHSNNLLKAQIIVLPQPLSPFHWKIIIRQDETYHLADIDLRQSGAKPQAEAHKGLLSRIAATYRPDLENNWHIYHQFGDDPAYKPLIREAWHDPAFQAFRSFAQFPIMEHIDNSEHGLCAWFYDLRFKFPELPPSFRYGVCRLHSESGWKLVRQRGLFYID